MNSTNYLLLAGVIVVAGKWAQGLDITPKTVVAIVILALMVSLLDNADPDIGQAFAMLVLVAVSLANGKQILDRLSGRLNEKQPASLFGV